MTGEKELMPLPASIRFIQRDWLSCNQILMQDLSGLGQAQAGPAHADPGATFTLIDSGYVKHEALSLQLVQHAMGGGRLKRIINTHLHADHCGGNALLARMTGCSITVPQASFDDVLTWDTEALSYAGTGQQCPRFSANDSLRPEDSFQAGGLHWEAFAAPGHDPKSLVFFARDEGLLISADALWENGFGILFPELTGDSGLQEQEDILNLIESLRPRLVMPGHGGMFTDVAGALSRARSRLQALRDNPERTPRNAIKALVKFSLLEFEQFHIDTYIENQAKTSVNQACALQLGQPLPSLLRKALLELCQMGAARIEGEYAFNREENQG
jgi:glyoxylase-like metal-dependent hydrolase (beta-lactamase superfamily II)